MTSLFSSLPALLLAAATATAQAHTPPPLLPAGLAPAGLRLQATFAASRPDQGMAVFGLDGQAQLHRAGSDLGNGLQLLRILADRVVLGHDNRQYYLPLRPAGADDRRSAAAAGKRADTAAHTALNRITTAAAGGKSLQASSLDEVRQQCQSSAMAQLSAAQQQEIQALGLCP